MVDQELTEMSADDLRLVRQWLLKRFNVTGAESGTPDHNIEGADRLVGLMEAIKAIEKELTSRGETF